VHILLPFFLDDPQPTSVHTLLPFFLDEHQSTIMTKGKQKQAKGGSSASNKQVKKRSLRTERSKHFWYALCQLYTDTYSNMSQAKFLCSDVSGTDIDGRNKSSRNSFARYMVTYGKNEFLPWDAKRLRDVKYHEIEDKLVHYIDLRSRLFKIYRWEGSVLEYHGSQV
jgi:hypothetical protein